MSYEARSKSVRGGKEIMKEIDVKPGMSIRHVADLMVQAIDVSGADVFCTFNGICVPATKSSTVESICDEYDRLCEIRREEYEASLEGIERRNRDAEEQLQLQAKADRLMTELPELDFNNLDLLIKWLADIEAARDRVGVTVDARRIQSVFMAHGFEPNGYCDDAFVKGDPEIERRWLIGQAIADVYVPLVRSFAEKLE